jgi:hypothetical protein
MGIIKKHTNTEQAAPAQTPTFEAEDGAGQEAVVAEKAAPEVKTVTRADVKQEAAAQATESTAVPTKEAEQPGQSQAGTAATQQAAPEAPKSTAVLARAPGGQLKTFLSGGSAVSPLKDLENAFQKAGIEIDYSTFPRLRVDAGCIATPEGKEAGEFIEIQVVSYSPSWTVTAGVDGDEGKKHVRFSDDGQTVNPAGDGDEFAGMSLEDYKAHLVGLGFEKASIKTYTIVHGLAVEAEEVDFAHLNEMVSLSLSPQSKKKFDSYIINRTIQAKMGRVQETSGNPVVRFTSERTKGKDNQSYFNLVPSHGKTAPIDLA